MSSILQAVWFALLLPLRSAVGSSNCSLFLAPSLIQGAGKGVFSGTTLHQLDDVGASVGVVVDSYIIEDLRLADYVFTTDSDYYGVVHFGAAMSFNHMKSSVSNIQIKRSSISSKGERVGIRPYSTHEDGAFSVVSKEVLPGQELTFTYGSDEYFDERKANYHNQDTNPSKLEYTIAELEAKGQCLSNIYVDQSRITAAGRGVFSSQSFEKGDVVSVSPVLVVPKHVLERAGRSSVLINYCISGEGTDVALLPMGLAGLINHGGPRRANVEIDWYDWENRDASKLLETMDIERDLVGAPSAPLYFRYKALRPIGRGEELLLSYGREWEKAWLRYTEVMAAWLEVYGEKGADLTTAPQFRHPIGPPRDLFPPSFFSDKVKDCVGGEGCDGVKKQARAKFVHEELNKLSSFALSTQAMDASRMYMNASYEQFPAFP